MQALRIHYLNYKLIEESKTNYLTREISQKGQAIIELNGHEFRKKRDTKTTIWRCSKWRSFKCPKPLITSGSDIISHSNENSHELNAGRSEARQIVQQMKETVKSQLNPVNSHISAANLQSVQDDKSTQLSLPSRSAITRTLPEAGKRLPSPPLPKITVISKYLTFSWKFCLFGSGKRDSELILIYCDIENLKALKLYNRNWLVDGTFKFVPVNFTSSTLYTTKLAGFIHLGSTPCSAITV